MTPGRRSWRIALGTVVWTIAGLAGCHGVPIARVAPAPNRPQSTLGSVGRAALLPATIAADMPSETSSIDPSNSATTGTLTPSSAIEGASGQGQSDLGKPAIPAAPLPPTPLLDAALVRAKSRGELLDGASPPAHIDPAVAVASIPSPSMTEAISPSPAGPEPSVAAAPSAPTPEPKPVETVAVAPPASPEELWREGVRKLVGLARSKQEQAGAGNGATAEPWGLRARVLAWLAEPDIDPDLGQREADNVRSVLRALEAATGPGNSGKAADAHNRGDDVRTAVRTLEAKAPLELVDLRLCSKVERFGDFTPIDPPARRGGDQVVIYCEVDGVHHEPTTSGGFQTKLAGRMEIIPEAGGSPIILPLGPAKETFPRRRRDFYIAYLEVLPRNLPPGQYTLRMTLKDVFSEQSAGRGIPLTIVGDKPLDAATPHEPGPTL